MTRVVKPPTPLTELDEARTVFLAGSIEMGRADNWQWDFSQALADDDVVILNPRRDDWDAKWEQTQTNPHFRQQVQWELQGLELASIIAMYLQPATKSPITLLELGLFARSGKMVVCCPDGFWRKGNVEITCATYGVPLVDTVDDMVRFVKTWFADRK